jgi:hypothetical protein
MARKRWVMTPARRAYYDSKRKGRADNKLVQKAMHKRVTRDRFFPGHTISGGLGNLPMANILDIKDKTVSKKHPYYEVTYTGNQGYSTSQHFMGKTARRFKRWFKSSRPPVQLRNAF